MLAIRGAWHRAEMEASETGSWNRLRACSKGGIRQSDFAASAFATGSKLLHAPGGAGDLQSSGGSLLPRGLSGREAGIPETLVAWLRRIRSSSSFGDHLPQPRRLLR